jgi:hypothetical protein
MDFRLITIYNPKTIEEPQFEYLHLKYELLLNYRIGSWPNG